MKRYFIIFLLLVFGMGPIHAQLSKRDSLEYHIDKMRAQRDFSPKDSVFISLLNKLASELRFYKTDSLFLLSQEAFEFSEMAEDEHGKSNALIGFGDFYSDKGDHDEAISQYQKAMSLAKELKDDNLILEIQNNIAGEYDYKGDYAEALSRYLNGVELATQIGCNKMLSIINENIANLYAAQEDYVQAIHFFKIVKKINESIGNDVYSAETMSNMASVYADMGELEYAMFNINSSIAIFEKHKIMDWLAYAYEVKGKTYLKEGDFKWALYWFNQSESLHQGLEDDRGITSLFNGFAEAYLGQGKDSISEQYALKAFNISKKIRTKEETQKSAHILYKINRNKEHFDTALAYHEIYHTLHDTLSANKNEKSLNMLMTKMEFERQKEHLMAENAKVLATQKAYIYTAFAILIIFIIVTIIVKRSEKIQKRLNIELYNKTAELVENEKELRDINEMKDKLFSIIGHDLRGPIAAFQGFLKLYRSGEIDGKEFLQFIPKLGSDIDNISFTLNNLLSWGRTQMNGSVTKPSIVPLDNLVNDNINLLSETAKNKSIEIANKISPDTLSWSDSDQIDIVIRNLISNAIKFTPENGLITIDAKERNTTWEVSVRDTGIGMDPETQKKIFEKNSNVTTYGTNDEKGTGLGLSLCKEMIEKNNGTIWVESLVSNGTCFYFTLPKVQHKHRKKEQHGQFVA